MKTYSPSESERRRGKKTKYYPTGRKALYHLGHLEPILLPKEISIKFSHRFRVGMNKRVWREHVRLVEDSLPRVANDGSGWGDFCIPAGADIFFLSSSPFSAFAFTRRADFPPRARRFYFLRRVFQLSLCRPHSFTLPTMRKRVEHNFSDSNVATDERYEIKSFIINISIIYNK